MRANRHSRTARRRNRNTRWRHSAVIHIETPAILRTDRIHRFVEIWDTYRIYRIDRDWSMFS